jgi:CheY-like chemotaxis protein
MSKVSGVANIGVLVVEDDALVAGTLERGLQVLGYRFAGRADSGEAGLRLARNQHPAVVLMDIGLEGHMDGIEAAVRIRYELEIPVVFVTAQGDDATLARAQAAEPFGYIVKPFELRELKIAIEVALHQFEALKRRSKDASAEAKKAFATAFGSAVEYIFRFKLSDDSLENKRSLLRMMGYESPAAFLKAFRAVKKAIDSFPGDDQPGPESPESKQDTLQDYQLEAYRKDGSTVWVSGKTRAIRDVQGNILYYDRN